MLKRRRSISLRLAFWVIVPAICAAQPTVLSDSLDPACGVAFVGPTSEVLTHDFFPPTELGGTWDPTPVEISQLEGALAIALRDHLRQERMSTDNRPTVRDYFRQYAGIYLKGRKLIFINGFHRVEVEETISWLSQPRPESELASFPTKARGKDFWRFVPVHVNDGGYYFFEAFYDPIHKRIVGFQFNGVA